MYQHSQGFIPHPPHQKKPKGYAVTSLILFLIGYLLHIIALFPMVGILFGCLGLICDLAAVIFLIITIAAL